MTDTVEPLILDLLEWIGQTSRPYIDVMDIWHTSCPKLPIWEEANSRNLVTCSFDSTTRVVTLTATGQQYLLAHRPHQAPTTPLD